MNHTLDVLQMSFFQFALAAHMFHIEQDFIGGVLAVFGVLYFIRK